MTPTIALTTDVAELDGVTAKRAAALRSMGLLCVAHLLRHVPARYEHEHAQMTIAELGTLVDGAAGTTITGATAGEIAIIKAGYGRRSPLEVILEDDTGDLRVVWFNQPWVKRKFFPGMRLNVHGKISRRDGALQLTNPRWRVEPEDSTSQREERWAPIYPASDSIPAWAIGEIIDGVLDDALALVDDHLLESYRKERALPPLSEAYRMVHRPVSEEEAMVGRRRLAYDEFLMLQLAVMMKRHHRQQHLTAPVLKCDPPTHDRICSRLPFELTPGQEHVIGQISNDLTASIPMNRLLQGDVGSGKTAVAIYALLQAVANGCQGVLMAPTELLAEQHDQAIREMLRDANVTITLLTGSLSAPQRRAALATVASGEANIVVGTHALLTEKVIFNDLGVAIADEQHRFGVHQRASLRSKSQEAMSRPHMLVMTATPIPRTLALTIFGDLDVSTITDLPPGRTPVTTTHHALDDRPAVYEQIVQHIANGEQAYIVVPAIEESTLGLTDVMSLLDRLRSGPLAGHRVEAMHGRMKRDEREATMLKFRGGEIDVLVATTVIEVGVDVANACLIVIEHADRFGLAQLHQLRGRVGRGTRPGVCILLSDPPTDDAKARIDAILATTNGFKIAEADLLIRGPGELLGARQSGISPFQAARLPDDLELLQMARRDAAAWIERDGILSDPEAALLRRRLLKIHGEALGLADVG
jgi:ATP-dependent DNA helicase RecG